MRPGVWGEFAAATSGCRHGGDGMALARRFGNESGQSLVLGGMATGLVLILLSFGVMGGVSLVSARAALAEGADAAALAALGQSSATVTLRVSYVEYTCRESYQWGFQGGGLQRSRALSCTSSPGQTMEAVSGGGAFAVGSGGPFGPLPGWAAAAGCVGTAWPGPGGSAAVYRICTGQRVVSAGLTEPVRSQMEQTSQRWLQANVRMDGQLYEARVTGVTVGTEGQVTVEADARVRTGLLMLRSVSVAETAWPGQLG